jgi:DNA repair protein RadD
MKKLRPYQQETIDSLLQYFAEMVGNPLIVLPTGSGKSLVLAYFIRWIFEQWPDSRVMVLTHRRELLEQDSDELRELWPEAPLSFWSASIGEKRVSPIIFAGIGSVYRRAAEMGGIELIFIDEAHLVPTKGFGMYLRFIAELKQYNPYVKVIGLTATPYRLDHGLLIDGKHIFTHHCYEADIRKLIEDEYLLPLRPKKPDGQIDMSGVHVKNHEFVAAEMEAAAMEVVDAALDEVIRYGTKRKSWLLFCSGIGHAEVVKSKLIDRGVDTEIVIGETPTAQRESTIKRFKHGSLRALVNVNVLTTGFNSPPVDMIALLRATMSPSLYVQMLGRGMRPSPETGKTDCLVLDFGGNIEMHGPIDQVHLNVHKRKSGNKKKAPVKTCPNCQALVASATKACPDCAYEFPIDDEPNHSDTAAEKALLSWEKKPDIRTLEISSVSYASHLGKSGKPSLRVTYECGLQSVIEYICIGHGGYAGHKALTWWAQRDIAGNEPETVDEALLLSTSLATSEKIRVDFNGEWPRIVFHQMPLPTVTPKMLQSTALAVSKKHGMQKVKEIIGHYDAENVSQISVDNFEKFYGELTSI